MISNSYFEVVAIKDHKPIHQSQLAFKKGNKFIVVETAPTGWWRGEFNGKSGLFPQSYVDIVDSKDITESANIETNNNSNTESTSPSSLLPPHPLTSLISVTNLNINDIKLEEFINNLPPTPNQTENNNPKPLVPPREKVLPPPVNNFNTSFTPVNKPTSNSLQLPPQPTSSQPKSPRFNVTGIQNSVQQQPMGRPQSPSIIKSNNTSGNTSPIYNTISGARSHSRKNSGPSTSVDEASDEIETNTQINYPTTKQPQQLQKPQSSAPTTVLNNSNNADRFKTLPSNITKTRTPLLNSDKIGMKDINPDIPYYIVRAMEPHQKQGFDELEVSTGELIVVYNHKDVKSDWWVGKIKSNFGIFPKKCVEIIKDISPSPTVLSPPLSSQQAAQASIKPPLQPPPPVETNKYPPSEPTYRKGLAMTTYNSQFANYLSFKKGDEIVLVQKEGEFWKGRIGNQIGLVSSNYISEIQLPNSIPQSQQPAVKIPTSVIQSQQPTVKTPVLNGSTSNNTTVNTKPTPAIVNNQTQSSTPSEPDDESVAQKIRESMSQFETREELLTAIQNLAIKFVKQTGALKKELTEEKIQRSKLENEIKLLESELDLLKSLQ